MNRNRNFLLYVGLSFALAWTSAAQLPVPSLQTEQAPAEESAAEPTLEERVATLEETRASYDERIATARERATETRATQIGVPLAQLEERLRNLEEAQRTIAQAIGVINGLQADREAAAQPAAPLLPEGLLEGDPPYPVREVDKVRAEADAVRLADEAAEAERALAQESARLAASRVSTQEGAVRLAKDAASAPPSDAEAAALTFRINLAQSRLELARAQLEWRNALLERAEMRAGRVDDRRTLLDERAETAIANMDLTPDSVAAEWEAIFAELDEKRAAASSVLQEADAAYRTAEAELEQARNQLNEATEDQQAVRQSAVTLAEAKLRTAERIRDLANIDVNWYDEIRSIWEFRRRVLVPPEDVNFEEIFNTARAYPNLIQSRRVAWNGELGAVRANISRLNTVIDAPAEGTTDTMLAHRRAERDSYRARERAYSDGFIRASEVERLASRLAEDALRRMELGSWAERTRAFWEGIKTAWNSELFQIDQNPVTPRKLTSALFIVIFGIILGRIFTRSVVRRGSLRLFGDESLAFTIERFVFYVLLVLIVLFALRTVNIPLTVFTLFGGALAIGVGLGGQTLANNFLSGIILLTDRPFKLGDIVEIDGRLGSIVNIGGRCSQLRMFNGVDVLVPNSQLIEQQVVNWTLGDRLCRFEVKVGVAYGSPTREVQKLIMRAITEHGRILPKPDPVVVFEDFGDSALVFNSYFWIELTTFADARIIMSDVRHRIDKLFKEANITIAFPQRDVHMDIKDPLSIRMLPVDDPSAADQGEDDQPKMPG